MSYLMRQTDLTTKLFTGKFVRESVRHDDYIENNNNNNTNENQNFKRYKPRSLDELTTRTKFSKKEIQIIYQGFKQDCPSGIVNEETFKNIYRQFFPFADTSSYAHLIFSTFDLRSSGFVTFEDFLICLSTLCRGTIEDRLKWIFTLYDTKKSGRLTKDDFYVIISAVYALLGNVSNRQNNNEILREYTIKVFKKFDKLHQGYITMEDFLSFCLQDQIIIQSIEALRITV